MRSVASLFVASLLATASARAQPARPTRGASARSTPATQLRFTWRAGQRVRYAVESEQSMTPGPRTSHSTMVEEVETVSVSPEGVASQRLRVVDLTLDAAVPEAQRRALVRGLREVSVEYQQDPRGAIRGARVVGQPDEPVAAFVRTIIEGLEQTGAPLPETAARVGQSWVDRRAMRLQPAPGVTTELDMVNTYTLRALRGAGDARVAVIEAVSEIRSRPGAEVAGVPLTASGGSRGTTEVRLDGAVMQRVETRGTMRVSLRVQGRAVNIEIRTRTLLRASPARATVDES
ncbi:MAG: hypothetical protein R3A52_05795 [Polyangiales bacterium]